MWFRNLVVLSLGFSFVAVIFKSSFQFFYPGIGVETTTENNGAKFPSMTFCSLFYNNSVTKVREKSNATFDDILRKLPKFIENVEILLMENALFSQGENK